MTNRPQSTWTEEDRIRDSGYRNKYGLSLNEYELMFHDQDGRCAICNRPPNKGTLLVVDHDHDSGMVRQLLCYKCNSAIGKLGEDPLVMLKAIEYLAKWKDDTETLYEVKDLISRLS